MTTNYMRGRAKEYYLMNRLKKDGFDIVVRTAGSHGMFDIIAIRKSDLLIRLIQVKPKHFSRIQEENILNHADWLNAIFKVKFEILK